MKRLQAEPAYRVGARLAEGPVWDAASGRLLFVDIFDGRLYRAIDDSTVELVFEIDDDLGAAMPAADGSMLLATGRGFSVLDADGSLHTLLDVFDGRPDLRFNDAKIDPVGRCLAGTASHSDAPADAALMRLAAGPSVDELVTGVGLSNGLGWSPDGRMFYYTDTFSGRVDRFAYDPDNGDLFTRNDFVAEAPGAPDGLCVDDTGCVWIALWEGGEIHRYTPDGTLDTVVTLPVPHITSCAFGGDDGGTLFITTGRGALTSDDLARIPHVGDVFAVRPGVAAPPATPWQPVGRA